MNHKMKLWLIAATCLILLGLFTFVGVMTAFDWDFTRISTVEYQTNTHPINQEFHRVSICTDTADITFALSENDTCRVVCHEEENTKHTVRVYDETLRIERTDTRAWYEQIGIHFNKPQITVYLPHGAYGALSVEASTGDIDIPKDFTFSHVNISADTGDVNCSAPEADSVRIKTNTGDIRIQDVSATELSLSVTTGSITVNGANCSGEVKINTSTGKTTASDLCCQSLISSGSTGDIFLKNAIVTNLLSVERSTGDITLKDCDAAEIRIKTSTGDVSGTLLSEKTFEASSSTGDVEVPKNTIGGICAVTTSTGDIRLDIK